MPRKKEPKQYDVLEARVAELEGDMKRMAKAIAGKSDPYGATDYGRTLLEIAEKKQG